MNWMDKQVSFYKCPADNIGRPATFRDVLLTNFALGHQWFYKDNKINKWFSGISNDLQTMRDLRNMGPDEDKSILKQTIQCFTPAGLLKTKKSKHVEVIERTGIMQLDFDYAAIKDYDIEELKLAVFDLPFIAFCGLSCSGKGFYALALIAEPERLADYAQHCFEVLDKYGVPCDTSKGRNVQDLRYVSYDCNMLIKDNPTPLRIKQFKAKRAAPNKTYTNTHSVNSSGNLVLNKAVQSIKAATVGNRWQTVQKWSYTLGGLNDDSLISEIIRAINESPEFAGDEEKYIKCAEVCFADGKARPLFNNFKQAI